MEQQKALELLQKVKDGELSPEEAVLKLKMSPFEDLGYAKIDLHRELRQGIPEVIFGSGKTPEQIIGIASAMQARGGENILITRLCTESAKIVGEQIPLTYDPMSKIGIVGRKSEITASGTIAVATGGTSDMPVAEEAALTAEVLGNKVVRLYDVGVAGLHRLLSKLDVLMDAQVVIAVAGMEGALASVVGGLVDCPVIAVPTSIGYGSNFNGLSALLSMLNSCASGVSVVNIDNGFGAGYLASMINHIGGNR
ncbi:nickel pincer cofactor biosynthesis protein LarB [Caproiciproducens faecalis]|uniref:Nickel pincer cofactor biosynthesis protein LarB n=1 Tax=Caproiciproducens faecalis TaxID=2820301 RepID=A0ABS7DPU8_9FIRM|nr:nickel pincer cofactor biosynthesis protein LarB [Caproiciproducens faecalis]MBW7573077.1 nickel pincer cofactor biosynthesis protein LarB [Caproiciproducens faecalis]